jgi:beta-lactamase regulating signal transducer with metallopeptidase domain
MATDLLWQLSGAAIRACALGLIACGGLWLFRVRSAAARHATWTVVVLGMLLQIALAPAVPGVRLRVLPTVSDPSAGDTARSRRGPVPSSLALSPASHRTPPSRRWISPAGVLIGVYFGVTALLFGRMALGLWGLRKILRKAKPLPELGRCFFESASLRIPASVGCFRAKILLPRGWEGWNPVKLQAVMAHETAHARRCDWLISLVSHVNVCIFWFHPLAWWIDRKLADLAEEACDDIALSEINDRDQYAATLVEFTRAAAAEGGLLNWGAISMAKESNVARRINRIMNWRLPAAKPFGRMAWVMLLTGGMPLIYLSAAVGLASGDRPARPVTPSGRDNLPLSMCIVIDNSGSMRDKRDEAKAAARALITASRPGDELCIVDFNDEAYLEAGLSTNFDKATDALRRVDSRGGSALRDAIQMSTELVEQKAHYRKVLVLITDGLDTSSTTSEEQVREKIKNSGVLVYSIALLSEQDSGSAEARRTLTQLAALGGGLFYHPEAIEEFSGIASAIQRDARNKR